MKIGAVAELTGVNERLLRYYEERGLLHPNRGLNGYREYDEVEVARVRSIRWLIDAGMPTSAIVRVAHCVSDGIEPTLAVCPELAFRLQRQRKELLGNIDALRGALARIESAMAPGT
ncbi:MerR family transcriptional regulator [Gryllotalpicola protaetiae]|uniref:MerR family transcriptional regulator n=1 Tax=Gryllotalpicola protaetiae TaxID=2419771 RepID=A0A387BR94_9MICO|nr:MerR family transcriptional regulator [Gryllotalpicola protaetiae]AYG04604.1 MerR family transcriptional regulator [Gryllotalpicola protaetiae]